MVESKQFWLEVHGIVRSEVGRSEVAEWLTLSILEVEESTFKRTYRFNNKYPEL